MRGGYKWVSGERRGGERSDYASFVYSCERICCDARCDAWPFYKHAFASPRAVGCSRFISAADHSSFGASFGWLVGWCPSLTPPPHTRETLLLPCFLFFFFHYIPFCFPPPISCVHRLPSMLPLTSLPPSVLSLPSFHRYSAPRLPAAPAAPTVPLAHYLHGLHSFPLPTCPSTG